MSLTSTTIRYAKLQKKKLTKGYQNQLPSHTQKLLFKKKIVTYESCGSEMSKQFDSRVNFDYLHLIKNITYLTRFVCLFARILLPFFIASHQKDF